MLFNSLSYYLFLVTVLALFFATPWRIGRWVLVIASYTFYSAAEPWYCLILLFSTAVDFVAAQRIHQSSIKAEKRRWLLVSLVSNLGILALFKYIDFATGNLNILLNHLGFDALPLLRWILPVGISFYTFQTISYTVDVYRGKVEPTRDFGAFALYVAFFPQLVAGPIERANRLLPQLLTRQPVTRTDVEEGVQRILWGVMKKTVFADRLAVSVWQVFINPSAYSGTELLLAAIAFSFQLYLDFSAYTDIAIGSARLMGVKLSENFNYPFLARSPSDFWSRWHITLTAWFRDYLYTPLGGTRRGAPLRTIASITLVMGLMGLWHGAEWHYVMFGLLSALTMILYLALRVITKRKRLLGSGPLAVVLSTLLANLGVFGIMVFFRADTTERAFAVITGIFTQGTGLRNDFYPALICVVLTWSAHIVRGNGWHLQIGLDSRNFSPAIKGLFWAALILTILYGAAERLDQFVYFQF